MAAAGEDLFDDLLNLEDNYYRDGYHLGVEDGSRTGRIEGRTFGLEKGFEKFFEMGRLAGKAEILEARVHTTSPRSAISSTSDPRRSTSTTTELDDHGEEPHVIVRHLPANERMRKHITTLSALTELASLSTENNEDAVSDFDDRLKRAQAKAKVIDNIIGERSTDVLRSSDGGIQPAGVNLPRTGASKSGEKNIEDFGVVRGK